MKKVPTVAPSINNTLSAVNAAEKARAAVRAAVDAAAENAAENTAARLATPEELQAIHAAALHLSKIDAAAAAAEKRKRENAAAARAAKSAAENADIINGDTIVRFADKISFVAARTNFAASGQRAALRIWYSVCNNINARAAAARTGRAPIDDAGIGADVVQTAAAALWECGAGKRLDDIAFTETDRDGNARAVDVGRAAFRAVNDFIHGERQTEYKCLYAEDLIQSDSGTILYFRALEKIRLSDFKAKERTREFDAIFEHAAENDAPLTDTEKVRFLAHYYGDSVRKIATDFGTTPRAVQKSLENARRKIAAAYGLNANEIIG